MKINATRVAIVVNIADEAAASGAGSDIDDKILFELIEFISCSM